MLDQIAPIARKVPWWADLEICRQAQLITVSQIARTASRYPFLTDIPKPDGSVDGLQLAAEPRPERQPQPEPDGEADNPGALGREEDAAESEPTDGPAAQLDVVSFSYDDNGRFRLFADVDAATGGDHRERADRSPRQHRWSRYIQTS